MFARVTVPHGQISQKPLKNVMPLILNLLGLLLEYRGNHVVYFGRQRQGWKFCTRSEEAQFDPSYHFWSKHALVHMQCTPGKWHLIILVTHTQKHRKAMFLLTDRKS